MKLETFFEKFDQFADAPDAIAKMRELVLQLAVTGHLVAQDKRDKPASSLMESAEAERAKLIAARKIKARPTAPVEADEQPYELPSSWSWARLSDVGYELGQKVPDKRFTYIDVGGIDSDKGRISDRVESLEPAYAPSRARKLVTRGTVIYSTVRPYLLNIAIVDKDFDPEPIASTAFGILHPFEGVYNRYLFYWLRSGPFTAYVEAGMKGMAYPAINDEKFYSGYIALPPLAEQKRIVAKVDDLMALCDRLEAQQQERDTRHTALARASLARFADAPTPANLNFLFHTSYTIPPADIRKSILNLAVQGKLLPQDPNDESAKDLLVRNDESRCDTAQSDHRADKGNQPLLSGDDRWDIPDTWSWRGLADLVLFVDYRGKTPSKLSSGVRLLTAKNVRKGQINLVPEEFLSESEYEAWMTRGFSKAGDVLFTTEAPMGNAAVVELTERFALAQRVICFQAYGALDPHFLVLQILSEQFQLILDKNGTGVTAKGIKASKLKQLPIAVPPLAEQRRIVAKVEQLMSLVDALETQLTTSRRAASTLMAAVVAELLDGAREVRTQPKLALVSSTHDAEPEFALAAESPHSSDVFVESLVIAQLVRAQGNSSFPLGRKRCTKLAYLAHRAAGDDVHSRYLKKAAGPYSPWSRYDGPEAASVEQGYVRITGPDKKEQFLPGPRIAEISQYFDDRPIHKAVDRVLSWFGKKSTDELELLATVDFAALELRASGKEATTNAIKRLIANEPEWAPKLDRAVFSDTNIAAALKELDARFRKDYQVNASGSARLAQHQ